MYKKYKIKKRKRFINPYFIFILFSIFVLFLATGYSYLYDSLNISGKANILYDDSNDSGELVYGNSTYTSKLNYTWIGANGNYFHSFVLTITNLDKDYDGSTQLTVSFDVLEGLIVEESPNANVWQAESVSQSGKTVTITFTPGNSSLAYGSTLTLYPHLVFSKEYPDLNITNVQLNGLAATLET